MKKKQSRNARPASQREAPPATPTGAAASEPLKLSKVREVFRLVAEVRELGADPGQWRPHMVHRLRRLIGAGIVVSSEVHFRKSPKTGTMRVIDIGWVADAEGQVSQLHTERDDERPEAFWLTAGTPEPKASRKRKDDAAADADDESPAEGDDDLVPVRPSRPVYGGTSFIMSQVALPHIGAVDQLGLHREWGDEPFTRAQHRLVRIFHLELARTWRRDVLRRAEDAASDLPPRLAQTLEQLLVGSSEKQIALKLELSRHTIHNYVKALHQRFEVNSRGELLAKAGAQKADAGPRLSLALPRRGGRKAEDVTGVPGRRGR